MSEQKRSPMNSGDDESASDVPGELPRDLKSLEAQFAALVPRNDRLDRERLMFLAGQASVDGSLQRVSLLGVGLAAKVWPRAFAAMTAVAAALFVALLATPSFREVSSATPVSNVASGNRPFKSRPQVTNDSSNPRADGLSVGDAHGGNIERSLATRAEELVGTLPIDDRDRPTLTPAAWRQVTGDSESPRLPADKSSGLPIYRGINS